MPLTEEEKKRLDYVNSKGGNIVKEGQKNAFQSGKLTSSWTSGSQSAADYRRMQNNIYEDRRNTANQQKSARKESSTAYQEATRKQQSLSDKVQKKQQQKTEADATASTAKPKQQQKTYQERQNEVQTDPDKKNALSYLEQQTTGQKTTQQVQELQLKAAQQAADRQLKAAENAQSDNAHFIEDMEEISKMSDEEQKNLASYGNYIKIQRQDASSEMGPEPGEEEMVPAQYAALLGKYGAQRLAELAESQSRSSNMQLQEQTRQQAQQAAQDRPISSSLATIPGEMISGLTAMGGRLAEAKNRTGRYSSLEAFTPGDTFSVYNNTVKGTVAQEIAGDGTQKWRQYAAAAYQAGLGAASSLARSIILPPGFGAAIGATNQFAQSIADASAQGATPDQAYLLATANAAVDYLMDKIPLDQLANAAMAKNTNVLLNILKQAGIEATTEGASFIGSYLAEAAILKESSQYAQSVEAYTEQAISQGMPEPQAQAWAQQQADKDLMDQAKQQLLVAGISGGVSGGIAAVKGNAAQKQLDRQERAAQAIQAEAERQNLEQTGGQMSMEQLPDQPLQNPQQLEPQPTQQPQTVTDIVEQTVRENQAKKVTPEQIQEIAQETVNPGSTARQESSQPVSTQEEVSTEQAIQNAAQEMASQRSGQNTEQPTATQQLTPEQLVQNAAEEATRAARGETVEPASVGAADENFSGHAQYQELLSDDNVQQDRRTDDRLDEVPKQDQTGRQVSEVAKNILGSRNTPDEGVDQVKDLIQSGVFSFDPKSNEKSLTEAIADIEQKGETAVLRQLNQNIGSRRIQEGDIEKAIVLYSRYAAGGEQTQAEAAQIYADLATMAQISGRNLQMFRLIRSMTPEGQVEALKKVGDNFLNTHGTTKGKNVEAVIPENLKSQYLEAVRSGDSGRQSDAVEAIYQSIGSQAPAGLKEKWDTWRYMCMLGNPTTQIRNVVGNAAMKPFAFVKDKLAAGMEAALEKTGIISKDDRTKSMTTDKDLLEFAKMDAKSEAAQDALKYSAKMGADVTKDKISEDRVIFDTVLGSKTLGKGFETARKVVEYFPEAGDMIFKNGYYAKYLANYLTAQGVSIDDIRTGKVSADVMAKARQYAVDNAYVNTFNDSNAFSDAVASLGKAKNSNNPVTRAFGTAVDAVLPFRRTPANILVRFKEYSVAEIAAAAIKAFRGKATASEICNSLASGLTGTAAMGIGAALAHGMYTPSGDGIRLVSKATDSEKLQGSQDYSIELTVGGKTTSYTVDWAAPVNMPLFVGANIYGAANVPEEEKGDWLDTAIRFFGASQSTLEPMLALSCLSSMNDLIQDVKYAKDNGEVYKILSSMATSYLSQGVPSLFRQAVTASHANKQTTFANDNRSEVREWQRNLSNIPGVGEAMGLKTDKIDVWGNTVSAGSVGERAFNSFLNPSKVSAVNKDDATINEINRLAETEFGDGVVPDVAPKTLTYIDSRGETHRDVRLTSEQWTAYATTRGQTAKKVLDKLIVSKDYENLTDSGKQAAIKLVYEYADKTGAMQAMKDNDGYPESWMEEAAQSKDPGAYIVGKVSNSAMTNALKAMTNAWDHGSDRPAQQKILEDSYDSFAKQSETIQQAIMDAAEGAAKKYLEGRQAGLSSAETLSALKSVQAIPKENRGKAAYQFQAIADTKGLSEDDIDIAMKLYMKDYDPEAKSPDISELYYDYIRNDLGYSAKDYAAFRYAYNVGDSEYGNDNGSTSKAEYMAAMAAAGYDQKTATEIYNTLWNGSSKKHAAIRKQVLDLYG